MKIDILARVIARKTLKAMAEAIGDSEPTPKQRSEALRCLITVLTELNNGVTGNELWEQATSKLDGPSAYSLQSQGLWPASRKTEETR